jgi:hypothetical protein
VANAHGGAEHAALAVGERVAVTSARLLEAKTVAPLSSIRPAFLAGAVVR